MKPRHPKRFATAMTKVRSHLGEEKCAEIVDRSSSLIRKWADPDHASVPNLQQALLLDRAFVEGGFGKPPLLEVYNLLLADALEQSESERAPIDMPIEALSLQGVVGDLSEAIRESLAENGDGGRIITPREKVAILEILERLDDQVDKIEDAVGQ